VTVLSNAHYNQIRYIRPISGVDGHMVVTDH